MNVWRSFLAMTLCLLLGLTGQAQAFARGQAPAEGKILICFGHLSKTVYVDSEGQPTSPPELCADCLNLLTAVLPVSGAAIASPLSYTLSLEPAPYTPTTISTPVRIHPARAPPVAVI